MLYVSRNRFLKAFTSLLCAAAIPFSLSACRLKSNNDEKLSALQSGEYYDEDGLLSASITQPLSESWITVSNNSSQFEVTGTCTKESALISLLVNEADAPGATTALCAGGSFSLKFDATALANSDHEFAVQITTDLGTSKTSGTVVIHKDASAPAVSLSNVDPIALPGKTLKFDYGLSDSGQGLASAKLYFAADGSAFSEISTLSAAQTTGQITVPSNAASSHAAKLRIIATDGVGNTTQVESLPFHIHTQLDTFAGVTNAHGKRDGVGTVTRFESIRKMVKVGNIIYFTENPLVRKMDISDPNNPVISTLAGHPIETGSVTSTATATEARFNSPFGLTYDGSYLYMVDLGLHAIYKIHPTNGNVELFAGTPGTSGTADNVTRTQALFKNPRGIVYAGGNFYVADSSNSVIRKIDSSGNVTTFAGTIGTSGSTNATGSAARFNVPYYIEAEYDSGASKYWLYVGDRGNHKIRKIDVSNAAVTTLAGATGGGFQDGTTQAAFLNPDGFAVSGSNLYVADETNAAIRVVNTSTGAVTTLTGRPLMTGEVDGAPGTARLRWPSDIVIDGNTAYVSEVNLASIKKVALDTGVVTTIAGSSGIFRNYNEDGARFTSGIRTLTAEGTLLWLVDVTTHAVRKIDTVARTVTTVAGTLGPGYSNAQGTSAAFYQPYAVVKVGANYYFTDRGNSVIRKMDGSGNVTLLAGVAGSVGSNNTSNGPVKFNSPAGMTTIGDNLFVVDVSNQSIRKIDVSDPANPIVTHFAGTNGSAGITDGAPGTGKLRNPAHVLAVGTDLYVSDAGNHTIRKIDSAGNLSTIAGTAQTAGNDDGVGTAAKFNNPTAMASDAAGDYLYLADAGGNRIRRIKITAPNLGEVVTVAGSPTGGTGARDGIGTLAGLNNPNGIARIGSLFYISDPNNTLIRVFDPATGALGTYAGTPSVNGAADGTIDDSKVKLAGIAKVGSDFYATDQKNSVIWKINAAGAATLFSGAYRIANTTDGSLSQARWAQPRQICAVGQVLYIGETAAGTIRKIDLGTNTVSTVAGSGTAYGGTDGTGTSARFSGINDMHCANGKIYVADAGHVIRVLDLTSLQVTTLAGTYGTSGSTNGPGASALFNTPTGITFVNNAVYVADQGNYVIRKIDVSDPANPVVSTFAGALGSRGYLLSSGTGAKFNYLYGLTHDGKYLYSADQGNHLIQRIDLSTAEVTDFLGSYGTFGHFDGPVPATPLFSTVQPRFIDGELYFVERGDCIRRVR